MLDWLNKKKYVINKLKKKISKSLLISIDDLDIL